MRFVKDTLGTFSTQAVIFVFSVAIGIITARALQPYGKGLYTIVIFVQTICLLVGNLGIGNAAIYLFGKKKYSLADLASGMLFLAFAIGFVIFALFLFIFDFLESSIFAQVNSEYLYLIVVSVPFALVTLYYGNLLQSGGKFSHFNLTEIIRIVVRFVGIAVALVVLQKGVLWAVLSWVFAEILAFFTSIVFVKKLTNIPLKPQWQAMKDSCSFGVKSYSEILLLYLNYQIDILLVMYLLRDPIQVGYYSIAISVSRIIWHIPNSIGIALFPRISAATNEESNRFTSIACRHTLFLTCLVSLVFLLAGNWVIPLMYGKVYMPSVIPFYLLLPGVIATGLFKQLNRNFTGRGKPLLSGLSAATGLAINVILNVILIPILGINGAAIASTFSFVTIAFVSLVLFLNISGNSIGEILLIKSEDLAIYLSMFKTFWTNVKVKHRMKFES